MDSLKGRVETMMEITRCVCVCVCERETAGLHHDVLHFYLLSIFPTLQEVRQVGVTNISYINTSSGQQLNKSMQASRREGCNHVTTFSQFKLGIMRCLCYLIKIMKHKNVTATEKKILSTTTLSLVRYCGPTATITCV